VFAGLDPTRVTITINNMGGFNAGNVTDNAITLLHELGHVYNRLALGGSAILDDNADTVVGRQRSATNSTNVRQNCF
jgi:hypothetical protein